MRAAAAALVLVLLLAGCRREPEPGVPTGSYRGQPVAALLEDLARDPEVARGAFAEDWVAAGPEAAAVIAPAAAHDRAALRLGALYATRRIGAPMGRALADVLDHAADQPTRLGALRALEALHSDALPAVEAVLAERARAARSGNAAVLVAADDVLRAIGPPAAGHLVRAVESGELPWPAAKALVDDFDLEAGHVSERLAELQPPGEDEGRPPWALRVSARRVSERERLSRTDRDALPLSPWAPLDAEARRDLGLDRLDRNLWVYRLREHLASGDTQARRTAARAAIELGTDSYALLPELIAALDSRDIQLRWYVAACLARIGPAAAGAVDGLAAMLDEENLLAQASALAALGEIGPAARGTVEGIERLARDIPWAFDETDDPDRRRAVAIVTYALVAPDRAGDAIAQGFGAANWGVRRAAAEAAAHAFPESTPMVMDALDGGDARRARAAALAVALSPGLADVAARDGIPPQAWRDDATAWLLRSAGLTPPPGAFPR